MTWEGDGSVAVMRLSSFVDSTRSSVDRNEFLGFVTVLSYSDANAVYLAV